MPRKRIIMRRFSIKEISAVDNPAQAHARALIMKRADGLPDLIAKSYYGEVAMSDPSKGARTFSGVLEANMEADWYYEVMREVGSAISALDCSLRSIVGDSDLNTTAKQSMMRNSVEEFLAAIRNRWPDVEEALQKGFEQGESDMPKTAAEYQKEIEGLTEQLKTAQAAAPDAAKLTELQTKLDETAKSLDELKKQLETTTTEKDEAVTKAGMSDAEKEYMRTLDKEGKAKFMALDPARRKTQMQKRDEDDEAVEIEGRSVRKSVVGEDAFAIFKSQAERIEKQEKALAMERDGRLTAEYTKRAEDEFKHLPGEITEKVAVLKAMDKMDDKTKEALSTLLKAGNEAISKGFVRMGSRGGNGVAKAGKEAVQVFEKRVNEIKSRDKLNNTDAMVKARKEFPEEFKAYQEAETTDDRQAA